MTKPAIFNGKNLSNWFPLIIAGVGGVAAIMWWRSYLANQSAQSASASNQLAPGTQVGPDIGQAITDVPGVGPSGVGPWWMYYNTPSNYAYNPALTPVSGLNQWQPSNVPGQTTGSNPSGQTLCGGAAGACGPNQYTPGQTSWSWQPNWMSPQQIAFLTAQGYSPQQVSSIPTPPSGPTPPGGPYSGPTQPSTGGVTPQQFPPGAPV